MSASNTTRVPTTNESLRVIELRASVGTAVGRREAGSGGGGGREDECRQAEDDEQDQQDDGELPEPALHSPPASVDRGIATERAGQPHSPGLQQDGDDERDAHQDLADGQKGIHESCSSRTLQPRDAITRAATGRSSPPSATAPRTRATSARHPPAHRPPVSPHG